MVPKIAVAIAAAIIVVGAGVTVYEISDNNKSSNDKSSSTEPDYCYEVLDSDDEIKRGLKFITTNKTKSTTSTNTVTVTSVGLMVQYSTKIVTKDNNYSALDYPNSFSPNSFNSSYGFDYTSSSPDSKLKITSGNNTYKINGSFTKTVASYYNIVTSSTTYTFKDLTIKWSQAGSYYAYGAFYYEGQYYTISSISGSITFSPDYTTTNKYDYRTAAGTISVLRTFTTEKTDSCLKECLFEKLLEKYTDAMKLNTTSASVSSYKDVKVFDYTITTSTSNYYSSTEYYVYNDYILYKSDSTKDNVTYVTVQMSEDKK